AGMFEMTADLPLEHAPIGARRAPDECPAFVLKRVLSVDVHIPLPPVGTVEIAFVLYRQPCSRIAEIRSNRCAQLLAEDLGVDFGLGQTDRHDPQPQLGLPGGIHVGSNENKSVLDSASVLHRLPR